MIFWDSISYSIWTAAKITTWIHSVMIFAASKIDWINNWRMEFDWHLNTIPSLEQQLLSFHRISIYRQFPLGWKITFFIISPRTMLDVVYFDVWASIRVLIANKEWTWKKEAAYLFISSISTRNSIWIHVNCLSTEYENDFVIIIDDHRLWLQRHRLISSFYSYLAWLGT